MEAALLPPHELEAIDVSDYREKVVLLLSTARQMAADPIRTVQAQYKKTYEHRETHYKVGDWVLVNFPRRILVVSECYPDLGTVLTV